MIGSELMMTSILPGRPGGRSRNRPGDIAKEIARGNPKADKTKSKRPKKRSVIQAPKRKPPKRKTSKPIVRIKTTKKRP